MLGDYIASWASLTTGKVTRTATARTARLILPGIVTIASQPVRTDPSSRSVSATVGAVSCLAEDDR